MTDLLRDNLRHEADAVAHVDLVDRVRVGSVRAARAARQRAIVFSVGVVLLVVALAGTSLALRNQAAPNPVGTPGPRPTTSAVPAPTSSPTPTPAVTTFGPLPTLDPSPPPADLWKRVDDPPADTSLDGVLLAVPEWPGADPARSCGGEAVLSGGVQPSPQGPVRQLRLIKEVPDGSTGVVALFYCAQGQVGRQFQVVSYDRDSAGLLGLRGAVVASSPGGVAAVFNVVVAGPEIRVEVGDWASGTTVGEDSHYSVHQWRAYQWQGSAVVQVGGPTAFGPNPNMYHVGVHMVSNLITLTEVRNEQRTVSPLVTVVSDGTSRALHTTVSITMPTGLELTSVNGPVCGIAEWQAQSVSGGRQFSCDMGSLAPGSTVDLVPTFTVSGAYLPDYTAPPGNALGGPKFGELSVAANGVSLVGRASDAHYSFSIYY